MFSHPAAGCRSYTKTNTCAFCITHARSYPVESQYSPEAVRNINLTVDKCKQQPKIQEKVKEWQENLVRFTLEGEAHCSAFTCSWVSSPEKSPDGLSWLIIFSFLKAKSSHFQELPWNCLLKLKKEIIVVYNSIAAPLFAYIYIYICIYILYIYAILFLHIYIYIYICSTQVSWD